MAMKRSSLLLLRSSHLLASQNTHGPWHISQRDTWHPSKHPHVHIQSPNDTSPKLLPKFLHPFNVSMSTQPFLLQENPKWNEKHVAIQKLPKLSHSFDSFMCMAPILLQREPDVDEETSDIIALSKAKQLLRREPDVDEETSDIIALSKAKRLLRLAQLDALKERLERETQDFMAYDHLLKLCINMGVASSSRSATHLVKCLDDAGVILIFQGMVHLKPQKIAQLVNGVMPKSFLTIKEQEGILQEISSLQQEKEEIDKLAYKYSRKVLWSGFVYLTLQMAFIFRLTFWELSWDVMEPIAYFVTNITLLIGYVFFMITSKHPTYKDLTRILHSSKQKKLMKKRKFDIARLLELQNQYQLSTPFCLRNPSTCHS